MYMKIYEEVKDAATIGISGHIRPDGDCVGSCLAVYNYICDNYPTIMARGIFGTAGRGVFLYQQDRGYSHRFCNGSGAV